MPAPVVAALDEDEPVLVPGRGVGEFALGGGDTAGIFAAVIVLQQADEDVAAPDLVEKDRLGPAVLRRDVADATRDNRSAASDGAVAALMARAALRAADMNVRINLPSIPDDAARAALAARADALVAEAAPLERDAVAATGLTPA